MQRWWIALLVALALAGGAVALAQTPPITAQPSADSVITITYGSVAYEIDPNDGPIVAIVEERVETIDGVEISGIVFVRDYRGFRVAGEFVDRAGAFAEAHPGDVLALEVIE